MQSVNERASKRHILLDCVQFQLEVDRCLPFHIIPDKAEMQRRYWLGKFRKMILVNLLRKAKNAPRKR